MSASNNTSTGGIDFAFLWENEMSGHKHAALMALYAQDAKETDRPWERWQWSYTGHSTENRWFDCKENILWYPQREYRRKPDTPRTMTIAGIEVPMPITTAPKRGRVYWLPRFVLSRDRTIIGAANSHIFSDDVVDRTSLGAGLMHKTEKAATAHADALIKLNNDAIEVALRGRGDA